MDNNSKLKQSFSQAANSLTSLYKNSQILQEESYKKGKIDALNEIKDFCLKKSKGELKNLSSEIIFQYLQLKISNLEAEISQNNQQFDQNEFSSNMINFLRNNCQQQNQNYSNLMQIDNSK